MHPTLLVILGFFFFHVACTYHILTPISNYLLKNGGNHRADMQDKDTLELRAHLQYVAEEAFFDQIQQNQLENHTDWYSKGIAESDQKILLLGERISGIEASQFCGFLANQQLFHIPISHRDAIRFLPFRPIPIPIQNFTISIPNRWFRAETRHSPTIFVCYEGDSFLKIHQIATKLAQFEKTAKFMRLRVDSPYNSRCRIRGVLVMLDDSWNNRYLLPRNLEARVYLESSNIVARHTYTQICEPKLGLNQDCCLWKFQFKLNGETHEFHRCFGRIPDEAMKPSQIPEHLADLLVAGKISRRFLSPPTKVCREIEFRSMRMRKNEKEIVTMNRLDASKCAIFY